MKTIHEIIDEFYPTINHVELGELYCRDKVVLIVRDYMAQFEQLHLHDVVWRSEQLVCDHPDDAIIRDKPTDYCMACNRNI